MARPTVKRNLYRHNVTKYIYAIAHKTEVSFPQSAFPTPEPFALFTLAFQGRHPEDENTIVVSAHDLSTNFSQYDPLKADTPTKSTGQ